MDVSIVIPTKNAGEQFDKVLCMIFSQKVKYSYEVICVDSGSKDQTLDIISKYPVRLFQIEPQEFGHGKTRNFGASKGTGTYIVFITQDALPANEFWLQNFIDAMQMEEGIAGGFGAHLPYPDCNMIDKRNIVMHFKGFGEKNTIYCIEDKDRYEKEEGYRHLLTFFSDNNSCVRRDVWEKYPYEDVEFAEDQLWARKIIELGYKKVFCPDALVYHSHNYDLSSYFGRDFDEHKGLYQIHKYISLKHWYYVLPAMTRHIWLDLRSLRRGELEPQGKKGSVKYIIGRNFSRYVAGYLGSHYAAYPLKVQNYLDRHFSQQYKQRKA